MIGLRIERSGGGASRWLGLVEAWLEKLGHILLSVGLAVAALPAPALAQRPPTPLPAARSTCPPGLEAATRRRLRSGQARSETYLVIFGEAPDRPNSRALLRSTIVSRLNLEAFSAALQEQLGDKIILDYRETLIGFLADLAPEDIQGICDRAAAARVPVVIAQDRDIGLPERDRRRARRASARSRFLMHSPNRPPLGIDRVDERLLALDRHFRTLQFAKDVHIYVIDTGIYGDHNDFAGPGGSRVAYEQIPGLSESTQSGACLGHGTAVASVIAGLKHGIATEAQLHSIRVFDACSQVTSAGRLMAAVDWVAEQRELYPTRPMLVNISLASLDVVEPEPNEPNSYDLLDVAIERSVRENKITYVVAAGNNQGGDACGISPARVEPAITVSSIIPTSDGRPDNANQGTCIDLFAPGNDIRMAWVGHPSKERTDQGTSFAAPHVAGVAALVLQYEFEANPGAAADPFKVWQAIDGAATTRKKIPSWCGIANISVETPEKLLHWGSGSSDGKIDEHPDLVGTQSC